MMHNILYNNKNTLCLNNSICIYIIEYNITPKYKFRFFGLSNNIYNTLDRFIKSKNKYTNAYYSSIFVIKNNGIRLVKKIIDNIANNIECLYKHDIYCYITNIKYKKIRNIIIKNLFNKFIYTNKNYDEHNNLVLSRKPYVLTYICKKYRYNAPNIYSDMY